MGVSQHEAIILMWNYWGDSVLDAGHSYGLIQNIYSDTDNGMLCGDSNCSLHPRLWLLSFVTQRRVQVKWCVTKMNNLKI